ncbi:MAG: hypothetical protein NDI61_13005 [Bdellovibrionaceae bacterium]|nr:hypothetical protein [Pseudobdellovibrionaceae bacterium]
MPENLPEKIPHLVSSIAVRLFLFAVFVASTPAHAQAPEAGAESSAPALSPWGSEYSFHAGSLLPNQIDGITEIMPFVGLRYATSLNYGSIELGVSNSHAHGADYTFMTASFRGELAPMPDIATVFYAGPDFHYFRPTNNIGRRSETGLHVGSGMMMHLGGPFWLRADMKFNMHPGTALYIGFGFALRTSGEGGGGDQ